MLVQDVMQTKIHTVTPHTPLPEAVRLVSQRGIRHLPVMDGERLVGIVSDRDLKQAMASPATALEAHELRYLLDRVPVSQLMTRAVVSTGPTTPVEEAARIMVQAKIGALPVTDAGRLIGLVTETDVLALFVRAMGVGEPSSRLDIVLGDRPQALAEIVRTLEQAGATVASIVTLAAGSGMREAVVRLATIDPRAAIAALRAAGYAVRHGPRPPIGGQA